MVEKLAIHGIGDQGKGIEHAGLLDRGQGLFISPDIRKNMGKMKMSQRIICIQADRFSRRGLGSRKIPVTPKLDACVSIMSFRRIGI
jgi:hypothetical protein